jgi:hypothetical protein
MGILFDQQNLKTSIRGNFCRLKARNPATNDHHAGVRNNLVTHD